VQAVLTLGGEHPLQLPSAAVEAIAEVAPLLGAAIANCGLQGSLERDAEIFRRMAGTLKALPGPTADSRSLGAAARALRDGLGRPLGVRGGALWAKERSGPWLPRGAWGTLDRPGAASRLQAFLASTAADPCTGGWLPEDHPLAFGRLPSYLHCIRAGSEAVAVLLLAVTSQAVGPQLEAALALAELAVAARENQQG
jgi:hypothetical protein